MSTHTRAKTRRQLRHPGSRSASHVQDKRQGEARSETDWIGVEAPQRPSPRRSFGGLQGHEYLYRDGRWQRCQDPEELGDYLQEEAKRRSWYMGQTSRHGQPVPMKRHVAAAIETMTTTFAPWLSDWTADCIARRKDPRPKLAAIRTAWLTKALPLVSVQRFVLGYAFHSDTDDLHFDLCLSRQDGNGERIGDRGLRLVGPWCTAVDRQLRAGADIRAEKKSQIRRSIANFRRRYGDDQKPLDVELARALDTSADEVLGNELTPYRAAYARRVPELERQHTAAQLAVVESAKAKLLERTTPSPEMPQPMPPDHGLQYQRDFPSL